MLPAILRFCFLARWTQTQTQTQREQAHTNIEGQGEREAKEKKGEDTMSSWGFIRSTETPKIVIRLTKDEETIGRSLPEIKDFEELKYISRKHCIIRRLASSSSSSETSSIEIEDLK
jgi:hypothetical protein